MGNFKLQSRAFENGSPIPIRYTADGENVSPPLAWSGAPAETQELALICEDPDAPMEQPFVHWLLYGLSSNTSQIPEGLNNREELEFPLLARHGQNSYLGIGYTGPQPPVWHGAHRYFFRLFALDQPLPLRAGSTRTDFWKAIQPHIIAEAQLVGLYERPIRQKLRPQLNWKSVASATAAGLIAGFSYQYWKHSRAA